QKKGEVDILVSGIQADVALPYKVTYTFKGLSFIFGRKGSVDILETYKKSSLKKLFEEVKNLSVEKYDVVINDFEPVSAWACYLKNKPCIVLSHQAAVLNEEAPHQKHTGALGTLYVKLDAPRSVHDEFNFDAYKINILRT